MYKGNTVTNEQPETSPKTELIFFLNHKGVKIEKITWLNTFYNVFFRRLFQTLTPNGVPERDIPVCSSALSFYNESASWLLLPSVDMVVSFHRFFFHRNAGCHCMSETFLVRPKTSDE